MVRFNLVHILLTCFFLSRFKLGRRMRAKDRCGMAVVKPKFLFATGKTSFIVMSSVFQASTILVLADYEGERSATEEALLSSFYICLEFNVSTILIPGDFEKFDKF